MKNKIILIALAGAALFASCGGGHNPSNGKDTIHNTYGAAKDTSKADTSKVTSADNSATGGTSAKDTTKKDTAKK